MQEGCLTVVSVDFIEEEVDVFDISVEDDHSFLVHGAVLHNCVECGEMDGQSWEWGTPHPMPALHFSCRCSLLPLTKSFEQLARESHGNSRIAKVLDDIPEANRASMGGPVSGKLTYKDWFSRLSESRQREILGPGRFDLYKKGLIGYSDMIGQNGNELTLAELRDKLV